MSSQPVGGTYGSNLESKTLVDASESGDAKSPHLSNLERVGEYNRQKNWDMAAQLERTERGNIWWWTSKNRAEKT